MVRIIRYRYLLVTGNIDFDKVSTVIINSYRKLFGNIDACKADIKIIEKSSSVLVFKIRHNYLDKLIATLHYVISNDPDIGKKEIRVYVSNTYRKLLKHLNKHK